MFHFSMRMGIRRLKTQVKYYLSVNKKEYPDWESDLKNQMNFASLYNGRRIVQFVNS